MPKVPQVTESNRVAEAIRHLGNLFDWIDEQAQLKPGEPPLRQLVADSARRQQADQQNESRVATFIEITANARDWTIERIGKQETVWVEYMNGERITWRRFGSNEPFEPVE